MERGRRRREVKRGRGRERVKQRWREGEVGRKKEREGKRMRGEERVREREGEKWGEGEGREIGRVW